MIRFIDNTYLQSVGTCLRGEATNVFQVETFLRFVGEVVGAEQVFFGGDKDGPVYPVTVRSLDQLSALFGTDQWLRYADLDEQTFIDATDRAARHLIEEINQFDPNIVFDRLAVNPKFARGMSDPQKELHGFLTKRRHAAMVARYQEPKTSNFAGHVLSREDVHDALKQRLKKRRWSVSRGVLLATVVRMLVYDEFARSMKATYLPGSGRGRLWQAPKAMSSPLLFLTPKPSHRAGGTRLRRIPNLGGVIDALTAVSNGHPRELLRLAWQLRADTAKIRKAFQRLESRGDALVLRSDALSTEYQTIISQLTGASTKPRLFSSLLKTVSFTFGLSPEGPSVSPVVDETAVREWARYKLRRRHVHALAVLAKKAEKLDLASAYGRLFALASGKPV